MAAETASMPQPVAPAPRTAMQAGMRPLVISIDAGHGGQDPGAIGPNGNREKNVTCLLYTSRCV